MRDPALRTFDDFWPFYVSQHRRHGTRVMHFIGTTVAFVMLIRAVSAGSAIFLFSGVATAYAIAWAGHYFIEKNRPVTFTHLLWSFFGDLRMYWLMCQGRMAAEVERLGYGPAPISA